MIKEILVLISFFVAGALFTYLKSKIFKRVKNTVKDKLIPINASIGNIYKKNGQETFQWEKFKEIFAIRNKVDWSKDIASLFNLRKLIIYGLIISCIFAYGWYQGKLNTPVKVNLDYNKEWVMKLNGEEIYKPKNSNDVYIRDSKTHQILKQIKMKDMGILRKKLKPIGFILEPIAVIGAGYGEDGIGFEGGAGVAFLKYWKMRLEAFATNKGIYLGTSYLITDNSGIGIGAGRGWREGEQRIILYYRFKF